MNLKKITTKQLLEEILKREGVKYAIAEPYQNKQIKVNGSYNSRNC
ncbi:BC1881 family protein [Clostridium sp. Marseille-Q7071]